MIRNRFCCNGDIRCACVAISRARMIHLVWGIDLIGTRFLLALSSLGWAVMLFWPGLLFPTPEQVHTGGGQTVYAIMSLIMNEAHWGALFSLHGLVAMIGVLYDVRTRLLLWVEGILGCLLWTTATISCFASHFQGWDTYKPPAAMAAELVLTVGAWWVLVRYRVEDANAR